MRSTVENIQTCEISHKGETSIRTLPEDKEGDMLSDKWGGHTGDQSNQVGDNYGWQPPVVIAGQKGNF